jgi:hypothetical protein
MTMMITLIAFFFLYLFLALYIFSENIESQFNIHDFSLWHFGLTYRLKLRRDPKENPVEENMVYGNFDKKLSQFRMSVLY